MNTSTQPALKQSSSIAPSSPSRVTPILVFLASLLCYLISLTQVHTFDALSYVLDVDRKPWQELFHPHHIAYGPLGAMVRRLVIPTGWYDSARVPLQVVNTLAGSGGVTLFFALIRNVTQRPTLALAGSLLLGSSYAYWYYAVEVEVYTIAALLLIVCLWLIIRLIQQPGILISITLGSAQGLAVLFHQTNILLCVPIGIALLLASRRAGESASIPPLLRRMLPYLLGYALCLGIIVGGSYALVGFGISGFRSWAELIHWMTAYARTGWWGGAITGENWGDLGLGLGETLLQPGGTIIWIILVGVVIFNRRPLAHMHGQLGICLVAWLSTYGAFFLWWEPDNIEFWIASLPPALLLVMLALHAGGSRWYPGVWATLVIGVIMFGSNYAAIDRRGTAAYDQQRRIAALLAQQSAPDDLLLVPDGMQELYLPYYEERDNVFSLNQALFMRDGNWLAACELVRERVDTALERGLAVFVAEDVLYPSVDRSPREISILERFYLTQDEVTQCFNPYLPHLAQVGMESSLPTYYRLPSAQDLAEGVGWAFAHIRWGWQAHNTRDEHIVNGWDFVPEIDPNLTSPPLRIKTDHYTAIEIRMAATTAARDAQLFFMDEQGSISEERSIHWTLQPGPEMQTYRLDLPGQPGWADTIRGLRLDPVGVGDGGSVQIEMIRLLP